MKILITSIFEYPHTGGLSTHVTTLKTGLEALGHQVNVLSFSDVPKAIRKLSVQGPSFILNKVQAGKGFVWSQKRRQDLLKSILKNEGPKYDVINAQDVFAGQLAASLGLPTVLTTHGYMTLEAISKGAILSGSPEEGKLLEIEKQAYTAVNEIVTVDKRIKDYIYEMTKREAHSIKNFIDIEAFQPDRLDKQDLKNKLDLNKYDHILFVPRRLTKKNGVIYPILALPEVLKAHPNTLLIYAGDGEELSNLQKAGREHNLEEHVRFLGAVPHEKIMEYFSSASIVLVPSIHSAGVEEATSIAALEAMGSGTPVIAGAVGGLKEIIEDHEDGILVAEKDVFALSSAITQLLNQPELGEKLAIRARRKIEAEYSHKVAAKRYLAIYEDVVNR